LIIECVLATDMAKHGKHVAQAQQKLSDPIGNKTFFLSLLTHAADLFHGCRPFSITEKWTSRITEEFFQQGDKETQLGMPISFLCDRTTSNIPQSQVGFINGLILPMFIVLEETLPMLEPMVDNVKNNRDKWAEIAAKNAEAALGAS
jgi:hypothetical protein